MKEGSLLLLDITPILVFSLDLLAMPCIFCAVKTFPLSVVALQ